MKNPLKSVIYKLFDFFEWLHGRKVLPLIFRWVIACVIILPSGLGLSQWQFWVMFFALLVLTLFQYSEGRLDEEKSNEDLAKEVKDDLREEIREMNKKTADLLTFIKEKGHGKEKSYKRAD